MGAAFRHCLAEKFRINEHTVFYDAGIQKYLDGYEISPHTDIRKKLLLLWSTSILQQSPKSKTIIRTIGTFSINTNTFRRIGRAILHIIGAGYPGNGVHPVLFKRMRDKQ